MNPKIASRVRRQLLVAGAGALSFPVVSLAVSGPKPAMKAPAWLARTPGAAIDGVPAASVEGHGHAAQAWEGARLVLSGRLTDANGEAIARATIGLTGLTNAGITTLSDADGRFLLVTTAPVNDPLDLRVTTQLGHTLQSAVPLSGQSYASDLRDSFAAIGHDAGSHAERHADQRVWRSGVSLSLTA